MKTWNLCMYGGNYEDDLLEIRFNELDSVVDKFCIVECDYTHSGIYKGLNFLDSLNQRFTQFKDKILYYQIPYTPSDSAWNMELWSREFLWQQVSHLMNDQDRLVSDDLDEVPKAEYIKEYKDNLDKPITFILQGFQYCLDLKMNGIYTGGIMMKCRDKKEHLSYYRSHRTNFQKNDFLWVGQDKINDAGLAGWHYSSVSTPEGISKKMNGFAHFNEYSAERKSPEFIKNCIKNIYPNFGNEKQLFFNKIELNESNAPDFLIKNINKFQHLLYSNY